MPHRRAKTDPKSAPKSAGAMQSPKAIERWSGERLANWLGINASTIRTILGALGISTRDGYEFERAVPALLDHYRTQAEKISRDTAADTARQKRADADSAELDLGVKLCGLVSKDEMKRLLEMAIVETREKVKAADWLTPEQRRKVMEVFAETTLQ